MQQPANSNKHNLTKPQEHWYILGVGAVGGLWASQLTRWGYPVTLLARDADQQNTLQQGLRVDMGEQQFTHRLPTLAPATKTSPLLPKPVIQNLLVCTKAHDALAALTTWLTYINPQATLVLLQNGMGNAEQIQSLLPNSHIIGATTTDGIWRQTPNHLIYAGQGSTAFGTLSPHFDPNKIPLVIAQWLQNSQTMGHHLALTWHNNILTGLWHKLAVNAAINGLTAIYGVHNGELIQQPQAKARMLQLCSETEDVMSRCHIEPIPHGLMNLCLRVLSQTATNKSSMLQDIEAKRRTEIDAINGHIVRQGEHLHLPCKAHRQLIADVEKL